MIHLHYAIVAYQLSPLWLYSYQLLSSRKFHSWQSKVFIVDCILSFAKRVFCLHHCNTIQQCTLSITIQILVSFQNYSQSYFATRTRLPDCLLCRERFSYYISNGNIFIVCCALVFGVSKNRNLKSPKSILPDFQLCMFIRRGVVYYLCRVLCR